MCLYKCIEVKGCIYPISALTKLYIRHSKFSLSLYYISINNMEDINISEDKYLRIKSMLDIVYI